MIGCTGENGELYFVLCEKRNCSLFTNQGETKILRQKKRKDKTPQTEAASNDFVLLVQSSISWSTRIEMLMEAFPPSEPKFDSLGNKYVARWGSLEVGGGMKGMRL